MPRHDGSYFPLHAVSVASTVTGMNSVYEAQAARSRFQELTAGHKGRRARLQVLGILTKVMNTEGFELSPAP